MPEAGQRISSYLLLEKVGQGGFGEVWKARHHTAEETVAVKIPTDPEFVEQLRREGAIQRVLRHDHIVQTLELDASADPPYFIM
ncbi:MAG: protein kinase, partial [Planctomycetota bacterium]|nr:protein kinase [Planctomycetota bacterium]